MGQILSALARFLFPHKAVTCAKKGLTVPETVEKADGEFVDRVSGDDDIVRPDDGNFLRLAPADVQQSFEQLAERVRTRIGLISKKQKDGHFKRKRKMSICQIRSMALMGMKHFLIAADLISRSHYNDAIKQLDQVSHYCFELAHEVAFNKSHCWEQLKCYNNALDQAIKCILIDERSGGAYFKAGRLLHHKKRFFEAEYCFRQALRYSSPGDMLTVYQIRKVLRQNVRTAITQSGYEASVADTACNLYGRLSRVAKELTSGEAFRQKHMWSCSPVIEPAFEREEEKPLTAYDKWLKGIVSQC